MSSTTHRAKAKLEELTGKAKARVGKAIGNEQMQFEGTAKQLAGKLKHEIVKAGERTKGKVEQFKGLAKKKAGAAIKNQQLQAEGAIESLKGAARERLHR